MQVDVSLHYSSWIETPTWAISELEINTHIYCIGLFDRIFCSDIYVTLAMLLSEIFEAEILMYIQTYQ